MKKYLISLAVALMVCLLGISASAADTQTADVAAAAEEEIALSEECHDIMDAIDPNGVDLQTQMQIMTEVYEDAGWTVTEIAPVARTTGVDPKTLELAYSDIDKADPEMREKILDARETVIFHNSWINDLCPDGIVFSYAIDPVKKEIGFYPMFSELFPGWDPPRPNNENSEPSTPIESVEDCVTESGPLEAVIDGVGAAAAPIGTITIYNGSRYIPKGTSIAPNFAGKETVRNVRNTFRVNATQSYTTGLTAVNIGYQYFPSGNYGNYTTDFPLGAPYPCEVLAPQTSTIREVRARISTYETPGYAQVVMTRTT